MSRIERTSERFIRRLEVEFSDGTRTYRGISSDLSETGLFIRTSHSFGPDSVIDITIYLPGGTASKLKGIVRRSVKTGMTLVKNGMGIQILEKDSNYTNFIKTHTGELLILTCRNCGAKNKVPADKLSLGPRCGNCKATLKKD